MGPPQARRDLLTRTCALGRALLAGLLAACAVDSAREADRAFTAGLARVERVELDLVSTRPPRLRIRVTGSLPDACTRIEPVEIRHLGARIEIALPTRRAFGAACPPAETPFVRSIPLSLSDEFRLYAIDVNGVSGTVVIPPDRDFDRRG